MKLGGVKIINLDSLKGKFDLEEVWENIENGVLLDCQRDLAKQGADAAEQIVIVLETLDRDEGWEEILSFFYQGEEWNLEGLEQALKPFSTKSKDHRGNNFYSRNIGVIQNLVEREQIVWDQKKAGLLFLFLLLMLQVRPREEILIEDIRFLQKKLKSLESYRKETKQKKTGFRMYPYISGVLYLKDGKIINEQGKQFSPEQETIDFFTYTERLGILAFTEQGKLSECTEANVQYEIKSRLERLLEEEQRIVMAAAYGSVYLLLTASGQVISNVRDNLDEWKKICWIGAGLNSLTAIKERSGNLLEIGSDSKITEFSDVKAAYTWSEGKCRYGILKENGVFIMDDGLQVEGVCAANIEREGYVYTIGKEIYFRKFGERQERKYRVDAEGTLVEVWKYREKFYFCICGETKEQEQIGSVERELFY